ncbi:MAG: type I secretion system permease/ATPase [Rubellimicrobium sp.]|nr:type I secretion system permease/ATPase [Rubellimicrobium sp.]
MEQAADRRGRRELALARRGMRGLLVAVAVFGGAVNLLLLTGPLYMLNVYDRVLGSRSVETLAALTLIAGFLYAMLGILDSARGQVMARAALRLQERLGPRVFGAGLAGGDATRDLDAVHRLLVSPAFLALHDLPFAPLFLAGVFLFHPLLGVLACAAALLLVALALANHALAQRALAAAGVAGRDTQALATELAAAGDTIRALGMEGAARARWQAARAAALAAGLGAADTGARFGAAIRAVRLAVQSAMLGLGALLVLRGELGAGAMIAASILLGRALAPVEVIVGQWALFARARDGWRNLAHLLGSQPPGTARMVLPRPEARLAVAGLAVAAAPGQPPVLRGVGFALGPGQVLAVIGPSGSGKSALIGVLAGARAPAQGEVRLGGATLWQYADRGAVVGTLLQEVTLFEGSLRDNIARLAPRPDDAAVLRAAHMAGAHETILRLPQGYDTRLGPGGAGLSGGQRRRVGLARALYGDPVLVVLDEPDAGLDADGLQALVATLDRLRAAGACTVLATHRPALVAACDLVLALDGGTMRAFGPRDAVLGEVLANVHALRPTARAVP